MQSDKQVHFGWFVRHARTGKFSLGEFAEALDLTPRRVSQIEVQMREPAIYPDTMSRIAKLLGYPDVAAFEAAWRSTAVERPKVREAPKGGSVLLRVRVSTAVAQALRDQGAAETVAARILTDAVIPPASAPAPAEAAPAQSDGRLTVADRHMGETRESVIDPGEIVVEERIQNRTPPSAPRPKRKGNPHAEREK